MKSFARYAAPAAALALLAGLAWAQAQAKPINRKCPLKPDVRIDPAQTVTYKGKVIGLCCSDCTEKFKKNPEAYMGAVKADAHLPMEPSGLASAKAALDSGKSGPYLCVLLFAGKDAKTQGLIKALSDPSVDGDLGGCAYAKVEFKKDSDEAKLLNVSAAGTLVIVDPTQDPPKVIKSLGAASPASLIKELQAGKKAMEKK